MRRRLYAAVGILGAGALISALAVTATDAVAAGRRDCQYPAQVLDLSSWKLTLPTGDDEDPTEITQPELATYKDPPWFMSNADCTGVQFRAAVNGVTTSGSDYPRSELREMTPDGSDEAAWSADSGTHTMVIDEAITHLPNDKPEVVAGQIHDSEDDVSVFRLEDDQLYVTDGDDSEDYTLVDGNYQLGTEFEAKFVVSDGEIKAYYNGDLKVTLDADFDDGYFKAGAYTQANCDKSDPCSDSNYGAVEIYDLQISHED